MMGYRGAWSANNIFTLSDISKIHWLLKIFTWLSFCMALSIQAQADRTYILQRYRGQRRMHEPDESGTAWILEKATTDDTPSSCQGDSL